jgi:hypothetical protein
MRKSEFYASIFLLIFSLLVCGEAYRLSLGPPGKPGPGFVPFVLSAMLFALSGFYFFNTLKALKRDKEIHLWHGLRWEKTVLVFSLLFAYALLLEKAGFILCTLILLMLLFTLVDRQRWYWIYIGSPGITFLFYAIFKMWLKIQLPVGFLRI